MGGYPQINLDYRADLEIDQHNLEMEWIRIARQIMDYSEAYAQAIFDRNKAKEGLDVTRAEADAMVRKSAVDAQEKVTEAVVTGRIQTSTLYRVGQEKLTNAEYVMDLLRGAISAFQAKKSALENLVRLFGMKYYAEPYEPPGSDMKPRALEQGRLEATGAIRRVADSLPHKPPAPGQALSRDEGRHRYAIGLISEHGRHIFSGGPFPELQQALGRRGATGEGIYKLTKEQPDELVYVWDMKLNGSAGWIEEPRQEPSKLPPRPPQRPLPKRQ